MEGLQVGRIVHYVAYGTPNGEFPAGAHRAAIITALENFGIGEFLEHPQVDLCVMNPDGLFFDKFVPYDDTYKSGTWHWIEKK
jgi:hypothetical protein